ncbi:hypothetical protein E2C01_083423 [Portunus trituberculatus]|uniref:Uncharacterized protein n=1 Tax=Portunus trituberculatus TaxID=210409 RepID=A0A5B7J4M3_PORTR|nr:hypothetical protein [Portunus trituberculatus]
MEQLGTVIDERRGADCGIPSPTVYQARRGEVLARRLFQHCWIGCGYGNVQMLGSLLVVIVAVASGSGMHFSYDGTPLADGVMMGGAVSSSGDVNVASFRQKNFVPGLASSVFPQTFPVVSPVLPPPAPALPGAAHRGARAGRVPLFDRVTTPLSLPVSR